MKSMMFGVLVGEMFVYVSPAGRWAVVAILFLFGAVIGSFLNVVVYRLPRGMSLIHPGSRCPTCGHPIRWYDNAPILGWFVLGGRCRDCHAPISVRYPLVEALTGATSALVGWAALVAIHQGADVPVDEQVFAFRSVTYAFYFLLAGVLIVAALIELDGHVPSAGLLSLALVLGIAIGSFWPQVRPLTAADHEPWRGAYVGTAGVFAAAALGALAWPSCVARANKSDILAGVAMGLEFALVGAYLGARQLAVIAAASAVVYAAARIVSRRWLPADGVGWAVSLTTVTLICCVAWVLGVEAWTWLAAWNDLSIVLLAGAVVALVSTLRAVGVLQPRSVPL